MEFPHLGANCSYSTCNKLDFLPMKCDSCHTLFWKSTELKCVVVSSAGDLGELTMTRLAIYFAKVNSEHFSYASHGCAGARRRDVQVPECPLCGAAVPGARGEPPDVAVGAHIDRDCRADPARERRNKVFANRCSRAGCRGKEMVPLVCAECRRNFCFRHRHAADHECNGRRDAVADAALSRVKGSAESPPAAAAAAVRAHAATFADVQGNMSEDEALAHALALSMQAAGGGGAAGAEGAAGAAPARPLRARVGGEQASRCAVS